MTADKKTKILALIALFGLTLSSGFAQTTDTLSAFPNPFPTSTDITVQNLSNDTVALNIYDPSGNLLISFFENIELSGTVTVTFNADTLSDSLYFAILNLNSETLIIKLKKDPGTTGLANRNTDRAKIDVYPIPTSDRLTVSTDLHISEIEIYDLHGKRLLQTFSEPQGIIDLEDFDSGLYLLHLKTDEGRFIKRILKQ